MDTLLEKLKELQDRFLKLKALLNIDEQIIQVKALRLEMEAPDFWDNQAEAVKTSQEAEELSSAIKYWTEMGQEITDAQELALLAQQEAHGDLTEELEQKYAELEQKFSHAEFLSLFSRPYDRANAIISIHAGTGGVDAQDWAQMLERMYLRFAERQGFKVEILDRNYGNEAGIKSVDLRIAGQYAYGYLKSENGVHRLLRNSPFNADGLRQTSFALVEVIPEIADEGAVVIKDEDIRIDVFRSSGPGGQSVNTTDSAVRIVHLPTGITVACQTERSQHQNKENAFKILRAKLNQRLLEEREAQEKKLKGDVQKAEWGKQIRSYFLYGNKLVKDHRSEYETSNVEAVLDGDLEQFMEAYLRFLKK
ncbi:MAG TPA: peptide chain release factor 2 [Candidatus Saccharimonadales bacterium]|nr:peptide chain release factor 2 [Candidatus Saccharimonadales bacterium]